MVILTGAPASFSAAFRPPKPLPTITTRYSPVCAALLSILLLYKIQRDGKRLQKFCGGVASGVGAVVFSAGRRFVVCGVVDSADVYGAFGAAFGRCGNWMAHSNRATDRGEARGSARGSVFGEHERARVVCVGVAVRRGCGMVGRHGGAEWGCGVFGARDCGGFLLDISAAGAARDECFTGADSGAAGCVGVDDSFSGAATCGELVVCRGLVL